jgi:hypothetical protein
MIADAIETLWEARLPREVFPGDGDIEIGSRHAAALTALLLRREAEAATNAIRCGRAVRRKVAQQLRQV